MGLTTREDKVLDAITVLDALLHGTTRMADCRGANRVTFEINSSLNQPIGVRVIGGTTAAPGFNLPIGGWLNCDAQSSLGINCKQEDWYPFMGIEIQAPVAPTSGSVTAKAIIQEENGVAVPVPSVGGGKAWLPGRW